MKKLLEIINNKIKPYQIDKYLFSTIIEKLYTKLYECYSHDLKNITDQNKRQKRFCEIVHIHCYNQTWTTKTAVKNILKQQLSEKQYKQFGLKLIYAILDTGKEITDDPYSPECLTELLSEELKIMNTDPRLEAIALKIMKRMNLSKDGGYGNIILIVMIIGIILSLIRVIQECSKSQMASLDQRSKARFMKQQVKDICIKRTFFNKWRLKRIIREKLNNDDYKTYGEKLKNAILDSGIELSEEESFTLVEAANV
jgi:hypothetical protein